MGTGELPTMNMSKPIEWNLCLELANHKPDFAEEMLAMLTDDLPPSRDKIMHAFQQEDWMELQHQIHRIHGACCYCGVPKLKKLARDIETALKQDKLDVVKKLIPKLDRAIDEVLASYRAKDYQN